MASSARPPGSLRRWLSGDPPNEIDKRIKHEFGHDVVARLQVYAKSLPDYRFVDLYRAAERYCGERGASTRIESEHDEDLNTILHGVRNRWTSRAIKMATKTAWPIGPREEEYLPVDVFWLSKAGSAAGGSHLIVRVRYVAAYQRTFLEAASEQPNLAEQCVTSIVESSARASIYRNRVLELSYESGVKDEHGEIQSTDRLRIIFKAYENVADDDIVIDDEVRETLRRNVIDLHLRRAVLKGHRVPVRRGVLLYGPPGTGKTYACRYLCGKLPDTTRIIVTGTALLQVNSIFSLARMLQPSLVILEDVDLVFQAREMNLYSSVLGDLLDQMDGLRPYEDIGFVLTTNAIERMESAIKDRPGRISQCVYFGPPAAELRRQYLRHFLRSYEPLAVDFDELVRSSNGATQAFLKEWVHRAVQIATERLSGGDGDLTLRTEDFHGAMDEMKRYSEGSTGRIIGFHGKD